MFFRMFNRMSENINVCMWIFQYVTISVKAWAILCVYLFIASKQHIHCPLICSSSFNNESYNASFVARWGCGPQLVVGGEYFILFFLQTIFEMSQNFKLQSKLSICTARIDFFLPGTKNQNWLLILSKNLSFCLLTFWHCIDVLNNFCFGLFSYVWCTLLV